MREAVAFAGSLKHRQEGIFALPPPAGGDNNEGKGAMSGCRMTVTTWRGPRGGMSSDLEAGEEDYDDAVVGAEAAQLLGDTRGRNQCVRFLPQLRVLQDMVSQSGVEDWRLHYHRQHGMAGRG